jgi:hypothetical protein
VVGVVFFLALALVILFSDLHALASHRPALDHVRFWDYPVAIFNIYVAVVVCRDAKLRKNYPFGVAGICLMVLVLLGRMVAHWETGPPETRNLLWTSMTAVGIVSSGLILVEGVRWLRKIAMLT